MLFYISSATLCILCYHRPHLPHINKGMPELYHRHPLTLCLNVLHSGAIGTTSWVDRILGRLSAYLRLSFVDGVNDHSSSEYIRHFKQLVFNSKVSFRTKAKSIVKDAAKKVGGFLIKIPCLPDGMRRDDLLMTTVAFPCFSLSYNWSRASAGGRLALCGQTGSVRRDFSNEGLSHTVPTIVRIQFVFYPMFGDISNSIFNDSDVQETE